MIAVLRGDDDDGDGSSGDDGDGHNSFVEHREDLQKVNSQQQN